MYCFDPAQFGRTPWNHPKTGPSRARFLLESITALQQALRDIGSGLLTLGCSPAQALTGKGMPNPTYAAVHDLPAAATPSGTLFYG